MRADRHEALVDFLLEAVADEGTTPFPANVLAGPGVDLAGLGCIPAGQA
ncbi:MAG TPA: hypothetical protein VJ283_18730 [Trebonia sp.]|nr:hypothetical protein [Trebonia sp.]